jgi:hypothetical protein
MTNIGRHTDNIFVESDGNLILKKKLTSNRRISCFFSENDKTPNTDGFFELIDEQGVPIKRFNVQIKTTKDLKNGKYSLDTKILNYVFSKISVDPTFLFVVDLYNENILYRYISMDFLLSIDFDKKKNITLDFSNDNVFDYNRFEKEVIRIKEEHDRLIISKGTEDISNIQEGIQYLNDTLSAIPEVIDTLLPNLYRVGIATSNVEKVITLKNSSNKENVFKSVANYGAYFILKGEKRFEIEDFKNDYNYNNVLYDGIGDTTPKKYAQGVVSNLLEIFFNRTSNYVNFLPDIVLKEIVFSFLDKLGSEIKSLASNKYHKTFFKDSIETSEVSLYISKVMKYLWYILYSKYNLNQYEEKLRKILYRNLNSMYYSNGVDFIDLMSTFYPNNQFEKKDFKEELSENQVAHILSFLINEYKLYYYAIKELNNRNITSIDRIWGFEPTKDVPFAGWRANLLDERFFSQSKIWLTSLPELYREFTEKLNLSDLGIEKRITFSIVKKQENFYSIVADFFSEHSKKFEINIVDKIDDDAIHKYGNFGWSATVPDVMETKMPFYYSLILLIYKRLCEKYSLENKGVLVGNTRIIDIL